MKTLMKVTVVLWVLFVSLAPPPGLAQLPWDHPVYAEKALSCDLPISECEKALGAPDGVKMTMNVSTSWIQSNFDVRGTVYGSMMIHGLEIDVLGVSQPRVDLMISMVGLDNQIACQSHLEFSENYSGDWMIPSCYPMQPYKQINVLAWDRTFPETHPWIAKIDAISGQAVFEYVPVNFNSFNNPYP